MNDAYGLLTEERLLAWAREFEPDEAVGITCDTNACPLANYLNTSIPLEDAEGWSVSGEFAYPHGAGCSVAYRQRLCLALSSAIRELVSLVDVSAAVGEKISAAEFRAAVVLVFSRFPPD